MDQIGELATMPDGAVIVVARVTALGGREEALVEASRRLDREVKASEPGSLAFIAHRGADMPGVVLFYEVWRAREALEAHKGTPHLKRWFAEIGGLAAQPVDVTVLQSVG